MDIASFIEEWKNVRGKTYEFLDTVPFDKIDWRPHKDLGTFGMQIRHMGMSQKAYINGIRSGKIDFSDREYDKEIETDKAKAISSLKELDMQLIELLKSSYSSGKIEFHDGVYGTKTVNVETVLGWLLEHETYHQGIFTCYGRIAGLGKFRLM